MSDNEGSSSGGLLRTGLLIGLAVIIGFFALKVTVWAVKLLLWVAVAGAVAYGGYWVFKQLSGGGKSEQRALPPGERSSASDDDLDEFKAAMRELEQLKRDRGES